jgi:hypothetical protein
MRRLDKDIVAGYNNYRWARGVVYRDGNKFRLVDGYHRTSAIQDNKNYPFILLSNGA